jgi:hypothetical protein
VHYKKQSIQFLKTEWYITHFFYYCRSVTWWNVNSKIGLCVVTYALATTRQTVDGKRGKRKNLYIISKLGKGQGYTLKPDIGHFFTELAKL